MYYNDYSSLDTVKARVRIYDTSDALVDTCTCEDRLSSLKVSREGVNGKFFGFGIGHQVKLTLINIDFNSNMKFYKDYKVYVDFSEDGESWQTRFPPTYISDVQVNKKTGDINITAYDKLKKTSEYKWKDLNITETDYNLLNVLTKIEYLLFNSTYPESNLTRTAMKAITFNSEVFPNYGGNESIREVLDDIAEVLGVIYFILEWQGNEYFAFYQIGVVDEDSTIINVKTSDYFEYEAAEPVVLHSVVHTTDLGDNVAINVTEGEGATQYIRNNGFLSLRPDIVDILTANIKPFVLTPYKLDLAGGIPLFLSNKLTVENPSDTNETIVYVINDTITFQGTLSCILEWEYPDNGAEDESTPVGIGDKVNETVARVDKVNNQITLLTQTVEGYDSKIAQVQIDTDSVITRVTSIEEITEEETNAINERLDTLTKETALKVDSEGVEIIVEKTLSEGVDKVVTASKKYTFDDTGLNVSSAGSNISTTITEDGMRIYRAGQQVLTADNEGVLAEDLHATTYLVIGDTSRLEDRDNRTACFWIGG